MSFLVSCQDINKITKYRIPYVKKSRLSLFLLRNLLKGKKKPYEATGAHKSVNIWRRGKSSI